MSGEGVRRGDGIGLTTKEHTSGLLWGDLLPADEGLILRPPQEKSLVDCSRGSHDEAHGK